MYKIFGLIDISLIVWCLIGGWWIDDWLMIEDGDCDWLLLITIGGFIEMGRWWFPYFTHSREQSKRSDNKPRVGFERKFYKSWQVHTAQQCCVAVATNRCRITHDYDLDPWPRRWPMTLTHDPGSWPWPWIMSLTLAHKLNPWPWPCPLNLTQKPWPWPMILTHDLDPWPWNWPTTLSPNT